MNLTTLTEELRAAYANRREIAPPSARDPAFGLPDAYAVEAELTRLRRAEGHKTVGRKVGYANKAMWRVLKLQTLVWAHMYDDTVHYADGGSATLSIDRMYSPKIEPEIVLKLKHSPQTDGAEPAAVLEGVEWLALGFEIIDCVFTDWSFQPADFVASYGLHAALVVGTPVQVEHGAVSSLVDELARFTVRLSRNGEVVEEGSGKNALRSPALCLSELAAAIARDNSAEPLGAGELVSSGTLTTSRPIVSGETWTAVVDGIGLSALTLRI